MRTHPRASLRISYRAISQPLWKSERGRFFSSVIEVRKRKNVMKPKIITALAYLILVMSSFATTIKYDGPWMWNDLNVKTTTSIGNSGYPVIVTCTGTIEISGYKNGVASLEIPKKIEWTAEEWGENYLEYGDHILLTRVVYDLDVVAIADNAFNGESCSGYQKLETISIPSTVTKIGYQAFYWCTGLKSIAIPNGVTEIGESCFYHCTSLTSVTLPNQIKVIPRSCFYCTALRDVTIPASVVEIGDAAFYYTAIDTVNLSANCKLLGGFDMPTTVTIRYRFLRLKML